MRALHYEWHRMLNGSLARWLLLIFLFSRVAVARADEPWATYKDCRYLPNAANDGDSFHVRTAGREYIFRLYFVDAPETDRSLPGRLAQQAKYFHASIREALQIGLEAEGFTRKTLSHPFTVRTCKQDARGRSRHPRYFAFVLTDTGDLGEQLIGNGLARVYGAASGPPGARTPEAEWGKLRQLEREAKKQKIGGWGVGVGRLHLRATAQPSPNTESSHLSAALTSDREIPNSVVKLEINGASREALQSVPGIGRVLAKRIIEARPFASANGLRQIKGIGAEKYERLRPYFE
jgi:endonuclease YncB( thermonuclease family)